MRMQPVEFVALPAGKAVILDPHSYHIMLIDLMKQVKEGDPGACESYGRERQGREGIDQG